MSTDLDPQGAEALALFAAVDFSGKRVLEIGAGDGRLTFRFAAAARLAAAIDLDVEAVVRATWGSSSRRGPGSSFLAASALALPFRRCAFDVALLAWSL